MLATFKLSFEHEKWILDGCPKPAPVSVIKWPAKNASPPSLLSLLRSSFGAFLWALILHPPLLSTSEQSTCT